MFASIQPRIYQFGNSLWNLLPDRVTLTLSRTTRIASIICVEGYTNFRHVIPGSLNWVYEKCVKQRITCYPLKVTVNKVTRTAYLYLHGHLNVNGKGVTPTLFSHGDFGHPFTLMHLVKIAERKSAGPVFSLFIPKAHDDDHFEIISLLVHAAFNQIEKLVKTERGTLKGILGVGHSKGAILLAEQQNVHLDPRIRGVYAIAGRLNVPEGDKSCGKSLVPVIQNIYKCIQNNPHLPLFQIIPADDWNAPREAMAVKPRNFCHIVPGMHLSGIYTDETTKIFKIFLDTLA